MRMLLLMLLALGVTLSVLAVDPPTAERVAVNAVLATIDPAKPATATTAEEALVTLGETHLAAMRAALNDTRQLLDRQTALAAYHPTLEQRYTLTITVLESAIIPVSWQLNPHTLVDQWVQQHVKGFDGKPFALPQRGARVLDAPMAAAFPHRIFYTLTIPQYPVARLLPEPLRANNIFVVGKDGGVQLITDIAGLEAFFKKNVPAAAPLAEGLAAPNEPAMRHLVYAWLRLSQVLHQDGMFRFAPIEPRAVTITPGNATTWASGAIGVISSGGDAGTISVTIAFEIDGTIREIEETAKLQAGIRPICQATLLLDPNPLVRRIAEQDLLVMGTAAEFYVLEQRAKASPELRAVIDALWARIIREHR